MPTRQADQARFAPDILAQVQKDFGAEAGKALALLARALPEAQRVLRCIVFLAKGNLEELSSLMTAAATDYRDVIFWAEYVDHEAPHPRQVRDFNRSFLNAESTLPVKRAPRNGRRRKRRAGS
jgi:hypothetical protein